MSDCGRGVSLEFYQPKGGKHRLRGVRCPNIFLEIHTSVIFCSTNIISNVVVDLQLNHFLFQRWIKAGPAIVVCKISLKKKLNNWWRVQFSYMTVKKVAPVCCNLPWHSSPGASTFAVVSSDVVTSRICFLLLSDEREELGKRTAVVFLFFFLSL